MKKDFNEFGIASFISTCSVPNDEQWNALSEKGKHNFLDSFGKAIENFITYGEFRDYWSHQKGYRDLDSSANDKALWHGRLELEEFLFNWFSWKNCQKVEPSRTWQAINECPKRRHLIGKYLSSDREAARIFYAESQAEHYENSFTACLRFTSNFFEAISNIFSRKRVTILSSKP